MIIDHYMQRLLAKPVKKRIRLAKGAESKEEGEHS
jgi:hypothetical protein